MLMKEEKVIQFPVKKKAHKVNGCSFCDECIHRATSQKMLSLALTLISEIPLDKKKPCERRTR